MIFRVFFFFYTVPVVLRCMFVSQQLQVDGLRSSLHTPVLKGQHEHSSDKNLKTVQPKPSDVASSNKVPLLKYSFEELVLYKFLHFLILYAPTSV